jgi:cytoskeletal protein CcmA (bactofilin family)
MNNTQFGGLAACVFNRSIWMAMLFVLTLLLTAQAQTPDVKPTTTDAAHDSGTASTGRNVYRAGGSVHLSAPIKGDFYAVGGRVTVEQPVAGDAVLAGGSVTVRAAIGDDLRVAGGDLNVESTIGGELYASGGNILLNNAAVVADAVTLYAGNVTIEGKVNGPLKVYAQKVVLNGEVSRDVELNAQEIELGSRAKLGAALRYPVDARFKAAEGAMIGGAVTRVQATNGGPDTHHDGQWHGQMMGSGYGWSGTIASTAVSFVALLVTAALFLLSFTGFAQRTSSTIWAKPWHALAAGLAVFLGTPMLAVMLFVTLIGIPLGIVLMMLLLLMLLLGSVVGVFGIAQRLQSAVQKEKRSGSGATMIVFFAATLLAVVLFGSLPFIGSLAVVLIMLFGTGACALEFYGQVRARRGLTTPGVSGSGSSAGNSVVGAP